MQSIIILLLITIIAIAAWFRGDCEIHAMFTHPDKCYATIKEQL